MSLDNSLFQTPTLQYIGYFYAALNLAIETADYIISWALVEAHAVFEKPSPKSVSIILPAVRCPAGIRTRSFPPGPVRISGWLSWLPAGTEGWQTEAAGQTEEPPRQPPPGGEQRTGKKRKCVRSGNNYHILPGMQNKKRKRWNITRT